MLLSPYMSLPSKKRRVLLNAVLLGSLPLGALAHEDHLDATDNALAVHELETVTVEAHPLSPNQNDFASATTVIGKERMSQGDTSLGNLLSGERGIHADNFGAGSSRPVIRGQSAARVKVVSDSSETMDASQISPDHAVAVEPALATQIEVLRGPSTLLYGGGAIGGVVNVLDEKIPTFMPEHGASGEVHARANTVANEKLGAAGVTVGVSDNIALRVEGDYRTADNYKADGFKHDGVSERRVPGTWNDGKNGTIGASWIGERGFLGLAYTEKRDQYALTGHEHEYEDCHPHAGLLHCGGHGHGGGGHHHSHGHDEHSHDTPWVDLRMQRFDLRGEYLAPVTGIDKVRVRASKTDYEHDEIEGGQVATSFKNKGYDARVEAVHTPINDWEGVIGVQHASSTLEAVGNESFLPKSTTDSWAVFLIEHYQWQDFHVELGGRVDHQAIDVKERGLNDYRAQAYAFSSAVNWEFKPDYTAALSLSYGERMPNAQELYAHGVHLATNTFEMGDDSLSKEKSTTVELGLRKTAGDWQFNANTFFSRFDDYIYAETLDRHEDFRLIQYAQRDADFYGVEAEVSYQINTMLQAKVFGDSVRAKARGGDDLPRIPSARLGAGLEVDFLNGMHGGIEYVYGFKQTDVEAFEEKTQNYHLLNANVSYDIAGSDRVSYQVYLQLNNLLDDTYYNHASYLSSIPQPGRNITAGFRVRF